MDIYLKIPWWTIDDTQHSSLGSKLEIAYYIFKSNTVPAHR
jgi:hypothetical protein